MKLLQILDNLLATMIMVIFFPVMIVLAINDSHCITDWLVFVLNIWNEQFIR